MTIDRDEIVPSKDRKVMLYNIFNFRLRRYSIISYFHFRVSCGVTAKNIRPSLDVAVLASLFKITNMTKNRVKSVET